MADVVPRGADGEYRVPSPCRAGLVGLTMVHGCRPSPASVCRRAGILWEAMLDRVADADARGQADGVEWPLDEVSDGRIPPRQAYRVVWDGRSAAGALLIAPPSLPTWFGGEGEQRVRDLVVFARRGEFRVSDPTPGPLPEPGASQFRNPDQSHRSRVQSWPRHRKSRPLPALR
jgi:hypothetical protein